MGYRHGTWVAAAMVACAVAACGGGDAKEVGKAAVTPAAAEPVTDPAVTEALKRTTSAMTVGPSTAPVDVRFGLAAVPAVGQPVDFELILVTQVAVPTVRVEVSGGPDLRLVAPAEPVTFEKVQAGTVHTIPVQAIPAMNGTTTVTVAVTLQQPTGPESRTFQLPLVVGAPAGPPSG